MKSKKLDVLILNRGFWPTYPVIGEALLELSERLSLQTSVGVLTQGKVGLRKKLLKAKRANNVRFWIAKSFSNSSSALSTRVFDLLYFTVWSFWQLVKLRPNLIYVSTDPPILLPFAVAVYSKLFRAAFIYHLQDIHPQASKSVLKMPKLLYRFLRVIDNFTQWNASKLITLTKEMSEHLKPRDDSVEPILLLQNPGVRFDNVEIYQTRTHGMAFCGNLGRLQRIPLLVSAIDGYLSSGGSLKFAFAGSGVYSNDIKALANRYPDKIKYHGFVSSGEAAQLNAAYEWAMLPIENEVTRYAFPSKASSYVLSGAKIHAICDAETSVGKWVLNNNLGLVTAPEVRSIVAAFQGIEQRRHTGFGSTCKIEIELSMDYFVGVLAKNILKLQEKVR